MRCRNDLRDMQYLAFRLAMSCATVVDVAGACFYIGLCIRVTRSVVKKQDSQAHSPVKQIHARSPVKPRDSPAFLRANESLCMTPAELAAYRRLLHGRGFVHCLGREGGLESTNFLAPQYFVVAGVVIVRNASNSGVRLSGRRFHVVQKTIDPSCSVAQLKFEYSCECLTYRASVVRGCKRERPHCLLFEGLAIEEQKRVSLK